MKILSIDTASNLCTVAVLEDEKCIKEIIVNDARNHSEKIMPVIEQALSESKLTLQDINLIVCDKGIRIGVGTVLAFKDSLNIPCVGISSLESLAYNIDSDGIICSLIDAKNNNVYFGVFEKKNNIVTQLEELNFKTIEEIIPILNKYDKINFVGDGSIIHKEYLLSNLNTCTFSDKNDLSSFSLGLAGLNAYNQNTNFDLMPLYLRKSQAERALENK